MSLLDSLLKGVDSTKLNSALNELADAAKKVADALPDELKNANAQTASKPAASQAQAASGAAQPSYEAPAAQPQNGAVSYLTASYIGMDKADYNTYLPEDDMDCKAKILEVLAADYPNLTVQTEVSPATIGGSGKFMNYSIGVYNAGNPVLFIMIIGKATTTHREYRWSKEQAQRAGVTMINFIGHAPNRYWYISERLEKFLR